MLAEDKWAIGRAQLASYRAAAFTAMPLVVPETASGRASDASQSWISKLAGKTIGDSHTDQVRLPTLAFMWAVLVPGHALINLMQTFAKHDLPSNHRIVRPDSMLTQDHNSNRLNVHIGDDGIVRKVEFK